MHESTYAVNGIFTHDVVEEVDFIDAHNACILIDITIYIYIYTKVAMLHVCTWVCHRDAWWYVCIQGDDDDLTAITISHDNHQTPVTIICDFYKYTKVTFFSSKTRVFLCTEPIFFDFSKKTTKC